MDNIEQKKKLKASAARYTARSDRAPSEVLKKLISWGADEDLANTIINELKDENFLDEANWSSDVESLLDDFKLQIQVIHTHNDLRAKVDVPPLSWSPELAELAQEWADELSRRGNRSLDHRDDRPSGTGENAAAGGAVDTMLDLWSEEENNYNPSTGQCRPGTTCDHYSQMVWRNTTEIGCGIAPHRGYRRVMVCNYSPPGNFVGERAY